MTRPLPTIAGLVPYQVEQAIRDTHAVACETAARLQALPKPIPPLTLDQIRAALSATGSTPLNVFELIGAAGIAGAEYGTHDQRLTMIAATVTDGTLFWETDRTALYLLIAGVWTYLINTPMRGTLNPDEKPTDLSEPDEGFLFYSTDYHHTFRWTGVTWERGPYDDGRGYIQYRTIVPVTNGWQLCDGSTVDRTTIAGGLTPVTVPDLITDLRFIRSNSVAGGTGGSATTHTHDVDILDTVTRQTAVGAENTAGAQTRTTGPPSGAGGDDALPPYEDMLPYYRL